MTLKLDARVTRQHDTIDLRQPAPQRRQTIEGDLQVSASALPEIRAHQLIGQRVRLDTPPLRLSRQQRVRRLRQMHHSLTSSHETKSSPPTREGPIVSSAPAHGTHAGAARSRREPLHGRR